MTDGPPPPLNIAITWLRASSSDSTVEVQPLLAFPDWVADGVRPDDDGGVRCPDGGDGGGAVPADGGAAPAGRPPGRGGCGCGSSRGGGGGAAIVLVAVILAALGALSSGRRRNGTRIA